MAKTAFSTSNALTKKLWDEKLFRDTVKMSYFVKFMGKDSNALCQTNEMLTKSYGDKITFGIRMRLGGAGVISGQTLEGKEEALTTHDFSVLLERYRHAVRDRGQLDRQRAMFSIDVESEAALKDWGAEKIDQLCFNTLIGTASSTYATRIFYSASGTLSTTATAATAVTATEASDKLTPDLISYAKTWALTGGNRGQTPLRPIRINGKKYFVLLVHPDCMYDLKTDSQFSQARREALERSKDNPIFSGSEAIWDGVVIHEHENVPIARTAGAGGAVPFARNVLMGAQSLVWAWGQRPQVVEKDFDYGEEHGFAWGMTAAPGKPKFNSKDYGSVGVYTARTRISDAT